MILWVTDGPKTKVPNETFSTVIKLSVKQLTGTWMCLRMRLFMNLCIYMYMMHTYTYVYKCSSPHEVDVKRRNTDTKLMRTILIV